MSEVNEYSELRIVDSKKLLTKEGITNICEKYGSIKSVFFYEYPKKNISFIRFEDPSAAHKLLRDLPRLPCNLNMSLSLDTEKKLNNNSEDINSVEVMKNVEVTKNVETIKNVEVIKNPEVVQSLEAINITDEDEMRCPVFLGPEVSMSSLIEESKQLKSNTKISYNLGNDDLFGQPLNSKWEKFKKSDFEFNNPDFSKPFENYPGGEIKIEKKLSPKVFTGWVTHFNGGDNVESILKNISDDIDGSDVLHLKSLKSGMLVGAYDSVTNLFGRGYIAFIAKNSVNVVLIDYGRVINTGKIKALPEKYAQKPAYSLKMYTRVECIPQLEERTYNFKVLSANSEKIVLIMFDENIEIKAQLKIWQPSVEEIGVPYIDFKKGSSVEIIQLKDTNSAYLRSREKRDLDLLFSKWNLLALYCYRHAKFLDREPFFGEIVGFRSRKNGNYARGRIHKYIGDNTYCVKHMDYPYKENIEFSEMIELQFDQKTMPTSCVKVGLKGNFSYPIQFQAEKFVKHVIGARLLVEFDESLPESWKCVDLLIPSVKENLNHILENLMEPSWFKILSDDLRLNEASCFCKDSNLLMNKLVENSIVIMKFVMYHDGIFYMRDKAFGKSFTLLSNMIEEYCSIYPHSYLPHNDEICLGKFPDKWCRVSCDEVKPGLLTKVHSVDFGNIAFLNSYNMKKLPVELMFHPGHVYRCILDTSKQLYSNKLKLLEEYQNTDCEFTIIEHLDKNYYLINCPFFEEILM